MHFFSNSRVVEIPIPSGDTCTCIIISLLIYISDHVEPNTCSFSFTKYDFKTKRDDTSNNRSTEFDFSPLDCSSSDRWLASLVLQSQPGATVAPEIDGCQSSEGDVHSESDGDPDHPPQRQEEGPGHGHCRGELHTPGPHSPRHHHHHKTVRLEGHVHV